MEGQPWTQVQSALIHILNQTRSNVYVKTEVVVYNNNAELVNTSGTPEEVEARINTMMANGGTYFNKAFEKTERSVEYVGNILDVTITGSRSGLNVLMFYNYESCIRLPEHRIEYY